MENFKILGLCEFCGFAYKGELPNKDGALPLILCPKCKEETMNFDEESSVLSQLEDENLKKLEYTVCKFQII